MITTEQKLRVIVAAQDRQLQHLLKGLVEREDRTVVVGQAEDMSTALCLTKDVRPDVAIIDYYLPYVARLNGNSLTRVAGPDTAQIISEVMPNTLAILLCNQDMKLLSGNGSGADHNVFFSQRKMGDNIPFKLQELYDEMAPPSTVVFADVEEKSKETPQTTPVPKDTSMCDKAIFFGALGIASGWFLILTMFLAPIGVALALAGATTVLLGLSGKLATSLWVRVTRQGLYATKGKVPYGRLSV